MAICALSFDAKCNERYGAGNWNPEPKAESYEGPEPYFKNRICIPKNNLEVTNNGLHD